MGDVERYPDGTFCWIDLGTPDVAAAKAFYEALLGWETEDVPTGDGETSTLCRLHGKEVAGMHEHGPGESAGWGSSISTHDIDATTRRARELGAEVETEPFDVMDAGRLATVRDPAGASVSLWQPGTRIGARYVNDLGAWGWNELVTPAMAEAKAFYEGVFGWEAQDIPADIPRSGFSLGNLLIAGMHSPGPQEGDASRWTVVFWVSDADQSAAAVERLGGRVLLPPVDIPIGRFAIVSDPAGAALTLAAVPSGPLRGVDGS